MRKHFLILMLMALLPLASWAADLDVNLFVAPNMPYHAPVPLSVTNSQGLTEDTHYTVETTKFYNANHDEFPVADLATAPVGTYYVKVVGLGTYVGQTIYVSFHINGVEITAADIDAIAALTYTGSELKPEPVVTIGTYTLVKGTDYTVAWGNNINAGTTAYVTVTGIGNYSGEPKKNFTINPKDFIADNITIAVSNNEVTYDGTADQTATIVVTDKQLGTTLTYDKDYIVAYESGHKNVGDYTITVTGKGNYDVDAITADKKLKIGKATLLVAPKLTKNYDGKKDLPSTTFGVSDFEFTGLVDATNPTTVATTVKINVAKAARDAKEYVATVDATTAGGISAGGNYTVITQPGTFTINKIPLWVYADDQSVEYGSEINKHKVIVQNLSGSITGWASTSTSTGDLDNIKSAVLVYQDTEDGKLKVMADPDASDAAKLVLGNYTVTYNNDGTITAGEPTAVYGGLTNTKRNITIALNSNVTLTKEYDGEAAAIEENVTDEANLNIIGKTVGTDKLVLTGLTATVADNEGNVTDGTLIKPYKVTLSGATVSANADKYNINYVTTYYTVTKKTLTFTVPQQTVKVGDPVTTFNKTLFDVEGLVEADGSKDGLFVLELAAAVIEADNIKAGSETGNHVKIVRKTSTDPDEDAAIEAKVANYNWPSAETYKLVIVPATTIVLDDSKDLSTLGDADNATITFTTRELTEGVWTTMVLPFEATVRQISNALGYAVVDVLQKTGDQMNFKIFMGTIPAYTPFLVKTDADVNMNTVVFKTAGTDHFNIEVLAEIGGNRDNLTQSNNKYNFIGKVDRAPITENFWAVGSKMTKETFKFDGVRAETGETSVLLPLRAYITAKPDVTDAPVIYIPSLHSPYYQAGYQRC